jgi:myo-inositol-1(or 4)-monophosphatase
VACGRTEGFFELGLHLYDIAAGVVILEEAGGVLSGWSDGESVLETGNVCATNGHVHAFLKGILNQR